MFETITNLWKGLTQKAQPSAESPISMKLESLPPILARSQIEDCLVVAVKGGGLHFCLNSKSAGNFEPVLENGVIDLGDKLATVKFNGGGISVSLSGKDGRGVRVGKVTSSGDINLTT